MLIAAARAGCSVMSLVSVLDLDNTFFSAGIRLVGRGNSLANARFGPHPKTWSAAPNRGHSLTRDNQTVLLLYLSLRCQFDALPKELTSVRLDEQTRHSALADLISTSSKWWSLGGSNS